MYSPMPFERQAPRDGIPLQEEADTFRSPYNANLKITLETT